MLPESHSFLIRGDDGLEYGPVSLAELRDWVQENRAGIGTDVRRDEPNSDWKPWQTYPELIALLAEVHVTAPVPGQPGLVLAPLVRRIAAFVLDLFLAGILAMPLVYLLSVSSHIPDLQQRYLMSILHPSDSTPPEIQEYGLLSSVITDGIFVLYLAGFLAAHGKTPAKQVFKLRVVDQAGQKPHLVKSTLRALALVFSMSLFFLPLTYAFFNPQRRALHDYIAGTYVVEA